MAKGSGLGDNLYVGGYDLSGDVGSLQSIRGGPGLLDVTSINRSAFERIGGLRDGEISFNSFFNDAAGQQHLALRGLPTADVHLMYCRGTTLGNPSACLVAKQINYDPSRPADGSLTFQIQALANAFGLSWGKLLTAGKRTDTSATNGTGVDFGSGSLAFGLSAFLQVFSFAGTSVTVTIQESSDDGGGDAYAAVTGGAFAAASGITAERIETSLSQTVERYLRVVTTGTFSSAVFAVMVNRHEVAVAY